jgi:hypothetical protein
MAIAIFGVRKKPVIRRHTYSFRSMVQLSIDLSEVDCNVSRSHDFKPGSALDQKTAIMFKKYWISGKSQWNLLQSERQGPGY